MASFSRRVVVDIGASGIRIGELMPDRKGLPIFRDLQSMELGIDPFKTPDFFPAVLAQLESLVRRSGIKAGLTTLCLGGPSVFTRVIKVPQSDPHQVKQMVGYEAQQAVPAIEEACWDFQLFPAGGGNELEAMILAIKKESVEEMMVAANKAGLTVDAVELAPAAIVNAFRYNYPENQNSTMVLEVGARSTNIVMIEGNKIFCRTVPLGGGSVTQAIATDLQESFAGAETLKLAKGFVHPGGSYEDPADEATARISKLARGVVTRLHAEVERSITFFRSQQGGARPGLLLLAGGGAQLGLIDFFFREKLKIPVQYFQPFRRTAYLDGLGGDVQRSFPSWTCFVGAALRNLPDAPCKMNILSHLKSQSLEQRKNRPWIFGAGVAGLILLLLPGIHGLWQGAKLGFLLTPQKDEIEQAEIVFAQLDGSKKKLEEKMATLQVALDLQQQRMRWPILLEELAKKSRPGMWITKLSVSSDKGEGADRTSVAKQTSAPPPATIVEISGIFETKSEEADAEVVDLFCKSLEQGGVLRNLVTVERETPERSASGKTEQVALKFSLRGEWILGETGGSTVKDKKQTK